MHPVFPKSLIAEPRYVVGVTVKRYTSQDYNERVEMFRRSEEIRNRKETDPVFYEFHTWRNGFHPELSTRESFRQGVWFYVRKDIVCPNGDILVIESQIYCSMVTDEEIEAVKKMVDSVRALR
jgi:hypothetical protein